MTPRRAPATGARVRQTLPCLSPNGGTAASLARGTSPLAARAVSQAFWGFSPAALLLGALLLPSGLYAATHSTHAHRVAVLSAGKAPAHTVHDSGSHAPRASEKASSRRAHQPLHAEVADRTTSGHSSAKSHKGAAASRHDQNKNVDREQTGTRGKDKTKAHAGHKHHPQEPIDDPQPMSRAQVNRRKNNYGEQLARNEPAPRLRPTAPRAQSDRSSSYQEAARTESYRSYESTEAAPAPTLPTRQGTPGNVARNRARHAAPTSSLTAPYSGQTQTYPEPQASRSNFNPPATGVSQPDDDERLTTQRSRSAQPGPATYSRSAPLPLATMTAPANAPAPPPAQMVQGFGGEVDFRTPPARPGITMPRESAAEQARDLREAADVASKPMFVPLYARDGKLIVPPPLKGSHDILVHQNQMADDAGLSRIQDDEDLARLRRAHLLVDFPESASLRVNENLPENRRSARPWTVKFATDAARAFYARFGEALQVNSAVRTVAYQQRLQRTNGNAAAIDGEGASPHLTGQALDFGKRSMSKAEIAWMRSYLLPLIDAGKIDVEEEFQQACFHVSVYASYTAAPRPHAMPRTEVAQITKPTHTHAIAPGADDDNMR